MKDHLIVLGRAFTLTFSAPIVLFMDLYTALPYGVLFIWFESFPLVSQIDCENNQLYGMHSCLPLETGYGTG